MDQANFYVLFISALIPLIIGFIWYHPKTFGNKLKISDAANVPKWNIGKIALIYLFSLLFSYVLSLVSIHQIGIFQLFLMEPSLADANSEFSKFSHDFMTRYGNRHRSFGHGFIHGAETSTFLGLAFFGITALFEGKPLKQIWIPLGFCVLCGSLMAGLNCAFF